MSSGCSPSVRTIILKTYLITKFKPIKFSFAQRLDVGEIAADDGILILVTFFGYWYPERMLKDRGCRRKRPTVTNVSKWSPTYFVSNICHQQRCRRHMVHYLNLTRHFRNGATKFPGLLNWIISRLKSSDVNFDEEFSTISTIWSVHVFIDWSLISKV